MLLISLCLLFNVEIDKAIKNIDILLPCYHNVFRQKKLSSPHNLFFSIRLEVRTANRKSTLLMSTTIKKTS